MNQFDSRVNGAADKPGGGQYCELVFVEYYSGRTIRVVLFGSEYNLLFSDIVSPASFSSSIQYQHDN